MTRQPVVLLVEDEDPLRRVLKGALERDGFTILEAGDGVQALDVIERTPPDIVVLDLNLPVMDGFAVLSRLRTRAATATLPVIVLTANGDSASETKGFALGADEFLTKPFRPSALTARLRALLARP
jgi:DNA-binding response OmpR family regulator